MGDVVWRPQAIEDVRAIIRYINQFDPGAATGIGTRLFAAGDDLDRFPHRGRPRDDGSREVVTVPPYIIRYEVVGDTVLVPGVRHGRQRPVA